MLARMTEPAEPSRAERARTLVATGRAGVLASVLVERGGVPFGSLAAYDTDRRGRPILLLSALAVHTRNVGKDPRASLLVAASLEGTDALAAPRATLVGTVERLDAQVSRDVRDGYLARHPAAAAWIDLGDFAFHRLAVDAVWWVGGFADMGWIDASTWAAAEPDPLAAAAPAILAHMNADHADALLLYCRAFAGVEAEAATMTAVDRLGFVMDARVAGATRTVRLAFPEEARTPEAARRVLVQMVREARGGSGPGSRGASRAG
jgi:heme iron utilization protein